MEIYRKVAGAAASASSGGTLRRPLPPWMPSLSLPGQVVGRRAAFRVANAAGPLAIAPDAPFSLDEPYWTTRKLQARRPGTHTVHGLNRLIESLAR